MFIFAFTEARFSSPHYQSIRPLNNDSILLQYMRNNREDLDSSRSIIITQFLDDFSFARCLSNSAPVSEEDVATDVNNIDCEESSMNGDDVINSNSTVDGEEDEFTFNYEVEDKVTFNYEVEDKVTNYGTS